MTPEARGELLLAYVKGPGRVKAAVERYPADSLDFKPGPEKWSIQDVVFHLAETELNYYVRARKIIAEPGSAIIAFDQNRWAASLDVSAQPMGEVLELLRLLREMMARQVRALPEAVWSQHVLHPERGPVTLEAWLETMVRHLDVHMAQMERNYQAFSRK